MPTRSGVPYQSELNDGSADGRATRRIHVDAQTHHVPDPDTSSLTSLGVQSASTVVADAAAAPVVVTDVRYSISRPPSPVISQFGSNVIENLEEIRIGEITELRISRPPSPNMVMNASASISENIDRPSAVDTDRHTSIITSETTENRIRFLSKGKGRALEPDSEIESIASNKRPRMNEDTQGTSNNILSTEIEMLRKRIAELETLEKEKEGTPSGTNKVHRKKSKHNKLTTDEERRKRILTATTGLPKDSILLLDMSSNKSSNESIDDYR